MFSGDLQKNNQRKSVLPKSKRIRPAFALTKKRHHYNNYADAKLDWLLLFNNFEKYDNKAWVISSLHPGVNYKTAVLIRLVMFIY